jgi:hypothetical protein
LQPELPALRYWLFGSMINAIGNIIGGGSARISYAKQLAKAYEARVIADGGVVESLGCFTAFATALGAYQPPIALAATGIGETSFTANWKSFSGAKYYLLDVSTSSTFNTFVYENQKINAPATSYVVIGLNSGTTYYYRVRASTDAFDADYQAVLDYATTQGYTLPSAGQQTLQNQLVVDLKDGGIWSKLDTFGVFATDGDSDFALIDWIRLSDYTAFNSPTFTTNQGFQGNGTSAYINTNYNAQSDGTNYTVNNASTGFWSELMTHDSRYIYSGGSSNFRDISQTLFRQPMNDGDNTNRTSPLGEFKYGHSDRSSSTVKNFYENATPLGPYTQNTTAEAVNFLLLGLGSSYSSSKISLFYCGASFSAGEVTSFYNAFNNYITSL